MSRRRNNGTGAVRGPSSALTSFLAGLGVEPSAPLTWGDNGAAQALAPDGPVLTDEAHLDPAGAVTARTVEAGPSTVADSKRKRSASVDSDDLEGIQQVGDMAPCAECSKQFAITQYTKPHPKKSGSLCLNCCYALGIDPFQKPKAKPKPKPKAERKKITHYEERVGVQGLADVCIGMIGKYIEDVEQLGDIGNVNMDKVCRIISKSRLLSPATALLFYSVDRTELAMYDCTSLVHESYVAMANLCPNLESIKLDLVGQMTSESLKYWGEHLRLKRLELFGPFLVRQDGWQAFLKATPTLEALLVTQSPRIDLETVEMMSGLKELRLAETKVDDSYVDAIGKLPLELLDLSSTAITDDGVEMLLARVGAGLRVLNLSHNDLGDRTADAIAQHCPRLQELALSNVELSDEAGARLFKQCRGLIKLDMEKGHELADETLRALVDGSGTTLESLSILGWRETSAEALSLLAGCSKLRQVNIGWCRNVTDFVLRDVLSTPVETVSVWGCNQLTEAAPKKRGVKVVGIETHAI